MEPPKIIKKSALSLVLLINLVSTTLTEIRTLLHKNTKFIWSRDHQKEFDKIIGSLSNLDKLEPYNPENDIFALADASVKGLGLILFQKDWKGRSSILQAGSSSFKHAQVRWNIPELELLAVKYMLNKCNYYTAWFVKPIIVYSYCSGL